MLCRVFDGLVDAEGQIGGAYAFRNFEIRRVIISGANAKANMRI